MNLIPGGNTQVGTISAGGLYTAPGTGTFPRQVTVTARSTADPEILAEATVTILPVPVARADRVTVFIAPGGPTQASPLRAARVSVFAAPGGPTQAAPLAASRVTVERRPVITAVTPASVARGSSNVTLTLTGQGLSSPTALQFLLNGSNDTAITYTNLSANGDGTQATATISITAGATIAGRAVQITAGGVASTPAGTGTNVLQVTGP